jgi:hypothetical protein
MPILRIHGWPELQAALAATPPGGDLTVTSAPAAAGHAGPGWFAALADRARAVRPDVRLTAILDCADRAGDVLAALRAGVRDVVFTGPEAATGRLAALAAAEGAVLHRQAPDCVDLRGRRDLAGFLAARRRRGD